MILMGTCSICKTDIALKPQKLPVRKRFRLVRCSWCNRGIVLMEEKKPLDSARAVVRDSDA